MYLKLQVGQIIWKRHFNKITNVGLYERETNDTKFEAENRNISANANKMTPKASFVYKSALVHYKFINIADPVPANLSCDSSDPVLADVRSSTVPEPMPADATPSAPYLGPLNFKDPGAATS